MSKLLRFERLELVDVIKNHFKFYEAYVISNNNKTTSLLFVHGRIDKSKRILPAENFTREFDAILAMNNKIDEKLAKGYIKIKANPDPEIASFSKEKTDKEIRKELTEIVDKVILGIVRGEIEEYNDRKRNYKLDWAELFKQIKELIPCKEIEIFDAVNWIFLCSEVDDKETIDLCEKLLDNVKQDTVKER